MLGQLVEAVSGETFADYLQSHVLDPIGMSRTGADWPEVAPSNFATGYGREVPGPRRACPFYPLGTYAPAYGMWSSANDLTRFGEAMLNGALLLSPETKREMFRTHWADGPGDITWGFGFRTLKVDDRKVVAAQGTFEGYQTMLAMDPEPRVVAVVLTNALSAPARALGLGMIHVTNKVIDNDPTGVPARHLTGIYSSLWDEWLIAPVGSKVYGFDPTADRLFDEPSELSLLNDHTARLDVDSWSGCLGEEIALALGPDGRTESTTVDGVRSTRWFPPSD